MLPMIIILPMIIMLWKTRQVHTRQWSLYYRWLSLKPLIIMLDEFEKWIRWAKGILRKKNKDIVPGQNTTWTRGQVTTTSSLANPTSGATRWTIILISFSDNENHPNISITSEYVLVRCIFYIFLATPTTQKGKKAFATIPLPEHPVGISMCSMSRFFPFLEVNSELQLEGMDFLLATLAT